jgi:hypothetical protein
MTGQEFFYAVMILGSLSFALAGIAGLRRKQNGFDVAEATAIRFALEFSLCAVTFALVPFVLSVLVQYEAVVWHLSSILLAGFFAVQMGRLILRTLDYDVHWPLAWISLLVIFGILLTIEVLNAIWWGSLAAYASGLLWALTFAGIQTIAFICYVPKAPTLTRVQPLSTVYHGPDSAGRSQWMRRRHPADYPNRAPHTDPDRRARNHPRSAEAHRLAFTRPPRRSDGDAAVRPDRHTRAR